MDFQVRACNAKVLYAKKQRRKGYGEAVGQ